MERGIFLDQNDFRIFTIWPSFSTLNFSFWTLLLFFTCWLGGARLLHFEPRETECMTFSRISLANCFQGLGNNFRLAGVDELVSYNNQTSKRNTIIIITQLFADTCILFFEDELHEGRTCYPWGWFTLPNTRRRNFFIHRSFPLCGCSSNFTALPPNTTGNRNNYMYIYNLTYKSVNDRTECRQEWEGEGFIANIPTAVHVWLHSRKRVPEVY